MNLRTLSLLITVALIALLAAFNWNTLAAPSTVSLGVTEVQAPLGVLMLALTCLLGIFFIAYVLWLQGSVLMEARRHAKEMQAQRDLADKAEASRFTELRTVLEDLHARDKEVLMARLDGLEAHLCSAPRSRTTARPPMWGSWSSRFACTSSPAQALRTTGKRAAPGFTGGP
jgi:uncharacterized integral membrane protein